MKRPFAIQFFAAILLPAAFPFLLRGAEQGSSAGVLESGRFGVSVYSADVSAHNQVFSLSNPELINIPLQNGTTAQLAGNSDTDLQYSAESRLAVLALTWRPGTCLQYRFHIGSGQMKLDTGGSHSDRLRTTSPGTRWGVEAAWNPLVDTPVTPAVQVRAGYDQSDFRLSRLDAGAGASVPIDEEYRLEQWQGALSVSKRWRMFDPFAGVRVLRQAGFLADRSTGSQVSGRHDGYSAFGGLQVEFSARESLVVEGAFGDFRGWNAGFSIGF